ncbi:MAG: LysR family transcriptional regulator [Hyphomicrobiales bacterium]|nr:LysR family transcriptional regulator [Hyphomicrobiales bacterium]
MDTLARMRTFAAVVDAGGFSAAARELGRSKALISKSVSELEDEVGARLLNRTTRKLALTEAGEDFLREALAIIGRVDALTERIRDSGASVRGKLRVSAPRSLGEDDISRAILAFAQKEPEIELILEMEDRFVDLIGEGFDVAIRISALQDSSLIARRLAPFRVVVCAAPELIAERGAPETPEDLRSLPCVIDTNLANRATWTFDHDAGKSHVAVSGRVVVNGANAVRNAALLGLGFARVPHAAVADAIADGRLHTVLDAYEPRDRGVYAVYPHRRHLGRKTRAFVDHMVAWFQAAAATGACDDHTPAPVR